MQKKLENVKHGKWLNLIHLKNVTYLRRISKIKKTEEKCDIISNGTSFQRWQRWEIYKCLTNNAMEFIGQFISKKDLHNDTTHRMVAFFLKLWWLQAFLNCPHQTIDTN